MITNSVPRYRYPVYAKLLDTPGRAFRWFLSDPERFTCEEARKELPVTFVRGVGWTRTTRHDAVNTLEVDVTSLPMGLPMALARFRPDVIVSSDYGARAVLALMFARLHRVPFVLSSEEIEASATGRSVIQLALRRTLARKCDSALGWGRPAYRYLRSLGTNPGYTTCGVQPVDVTKLREHSLRLDRAKLRAALQVRGRVLLLVGRLLHRKGFHRFIEAWSRVPQESRSACTVLLVGEGPERQRLEELADRLVPGELRFEGFHEGEALANYFAVADVFVMPSLVDVWGLVINEALCFGLPVLASRYAGAAQDLIADRECGEVIDPNDVQGFTGCLTRWALVPPEGSPDWRRAIASEHSFATAAASVCAAVDAAIARRRPDIG